MALEWLEWPLGVAPSANIIAVKLGKKGQESFAKTTEIMRAIKYVIDKAQDLNIPVSINLSFGTNNGGHNGASLFETFIDDMSRQMENIDCGSFSGTKGLEVIIMKAWFSKGKL